MQERAAPSEQVDNI